MGKDERPDHRLGLLCRSLARRSRSFDGKGPPRRNAVDESRPPASRAARRTACRIPHRRPYRRGERSLEPRLALASPLARLRCRPHAPEAEVHHRAAVQRQRGPCSPIWRSTQVFHGSRPFRRTGATITSPTAVGIISPPSACLN